MAWFRQYTRDTDKTDKNRGGVLSKVTPAGVERLKVGHLPPINNLPFSAQKNAIEKIVARFVPAASAGLTGSQAIFCHIYSPSSRLRCKISVYFERDGGDDKEFVAGATPPTWRIRAMDRSPSSGRELPMQVAYPNGGGVVALPDGYEFLSAVPVARVEMTLHDANFNQAFIPTSLGANVKMVVTWEPEAGFGFADEKEKNRLYSLCSVVVGDIKTIKNNATP